MLVCDEARRTAMLLLPANEGRTKARLADAEAAPNTSPTILATFGYRFVVVVVVGAEEGKEGGLPRQDRSPSTNSEQQQQQQDGFDEQRQR